LSAGLPKRQRIRPPGGVYKRDGGTCAVSGGGQTARGGGVVWYGFSGRAAYHRRRIQRFYPRVCGWLWLGKNPRGSERSTGPSCCGGGFLIRMNRITWGPFPCASPVPCQTRRAPISCSRSNPHLRPLPPRMLAWESYFISHAARTRSTSNYRYKTFLSLLAPLHEQ
jgi:hypothetical protein